MNDYVKCDGFILFYSDAKTKDFHYSTETNISKGHEKVVWDMQDVMYKLEVRLSPWHYIVAEEHI